MIHRPLLVAMIIVTAGVIAQADGPVAAPPPQATQGPEAKLPGIPGVPDDYFTSAGDLSTAVGRMQAAARSQMVAVMEKERIVALTPEFLELKMHATRQVCDADLAAAKSRDDRLSALKIYLAIAEDTRKRVHARRVIDADTISITASDYMVAEAQYRLEKEGK